MAVEAVSSFGIESMKPVEGRREGGRERTLEIHLCQVLVCLSFFNDVTP